MVVDAAALLPACPFGFCVFCALKTHFGFNFVCLAKMNQTLFMGAEMLRL